MFCTLFLDWTKAYSGQEEIWQYLRSVTRKYDLYPKIKLRHKLLRGEWDEKINKWHVIILDLKTGKEFTQVFDMVISGIGGLRVPNHPEQFDSFTGPKMHSAEWDHSIELKDKVVAVVGSGASAVQIIPNIVDKVKKLISFQRNAAWVTPRLQVEFPSVVKWTFAYVPGVQWTLRQLIFWTNEMRFPAFQADSLLSGVAMKLGKFHLNRQIKDPELKEKLTPKYKFGCKRITPSEVYYPALARNNATVITSKITEVTHDTIVTADGTRVKPDVLILATGFKVQDYFAPAEIIGKGGVDVLQKWKKETPTAYCGIVTHLGPNGFFILGPNTALGHNTIILSIETQVQWIIETIKEMRRRNAKTVTVKKSAEDEYMDNIQQSMKSTVWGVEPCGSWYANDKGVVTALWPESLVSYYNRIKNVDFDQLTFE